MAYSKGRRLADLVSSTGEVSTFTDASIVPADLHATLDLTGKTITVATASASDNDTTVASTAFVQQEIASLVDSAPGTLNTLNELAAALGDDANYATTTTNSIALKAPLASPSLTGTVTVTGASGAYNTLQLTSNSTSHGTIINLGDTSDADYGNITQFASSAGEGGRMRFIAGTTETMNLRGGKVGIGTSNPSYTFTVEKSLTNDWLSRVYNTGTSEGDNGVLIRTGSGHDGTITLAVYSDSSYKMTARGDGSVHIGGNTTGFHSSVLPLIVGSGSGDEGMTIFSGTSNKGKLGFADGATDDSGSYRGYIQYDHNGDKMNIGTAGATRSMILGNGRTAWSANAIGDVTTVPRDFAFYTEGSTNGMEIRSNDQRLVFMGAGGSSGTGSDDGYLAMSSQGTGKIAFNANGVSYINGGKFGIGTTTFAADDSSLMHVQGRLGITENAGTSLQMSTGNGYSWMEAWDNSSDRAPKHPICFNPWGGGAVVASTSLLGYSALTVNGGIRFGHSPASSMGLNVVTAVGFNNSNTDNTVMTVYYKAFMLNFYHNNGHSQVFVIANGGGGVAFNFTCMFPGETSLVTGNGIDKSFTTIGSSPNTFRVKMSSGGGALTVSRTSGSGSYNIYVQVLSGG